MLCAFFLLPCCCVCHFRVFRLDDLDAAEPRPRRPVSASPFQVISVVVRPENQMPACFRIHCRFRAPLPGPFTRLASSCARTGGVASLPMPRIAVRVAAGRLPCLSSGQEREDHERRATRVFLRAASISLHWSGSDNPEAPLVWVAAGRSTALVATWLWVLLRAPVFWTSWRR